MPKNHVVLYFHDGLIVVLGVVFALMSGRRWWYRESWYCVTSCGENMQRTMSLFVDAWWRLLMQALSKRGFLSRCHLSCARLMRHETVREDGRQSSECSSENVANCCFWQRAAGSYMRSFFCVCLCEQLIFALNTDLATSLQELSSTTITLTLPQSSWSGERTCRTSVKDDHAAIRQAHAPRLAALIRTCSFDIEAAAVSWTIMIGQQQRRANPFACRMVLNVQGLCCSYRASA